MGIRPCPFFPRSQGFYRCGGPQFSTATFTQTDICEAVACVKSLSSYISGLLANTACDTCSASSQTVSACAALVRDILEFPENYVDCNPQGSLPAVLRQLLANLLNICLCTETLQGERVGGVELEYRVNLDDFQDEAIALGLSGCVTVLELILLANQFLEDCTTANSSALAAILEAMAQEAGATIIVPFSSCP